MRERRHGPRAAILRLWALVAAICTLATVAGYAVADAATGELRARRSTASRPAPCW